MMKTTAFGTNSLTTRKRNHFYIADRRQGAILCRLSARKSMTLIKHQLIFTHLYGIMRFKQEKGGSLLW